MGRRTKAQKEAVPAEAPPRQIIVMDSVVRVGSCEGEAGVRVVLDYGTPVTAGYVTLELEQALQLFRDLGALLGITINDVAPDAAPEAATARLVDPTGKALIK